jgi:hypothetical protein
MNHNGVISRPLSSAFVGLSGQAVDLDGSGNVVAGTAKKAIGVLLHDVSEAESKQPAAIHLFSSGGIFNIFCIGTTAIGTPNNLGVKGLATPAGAADKEIPRFIPLEVGAANGVIEAILLSN